MVLASQVPFSATYSPSDNVFGNYKRIELPLDGEAAFGTSSIEEVIAAEKGKHVVLSHKEYPHLSLRIKQMSRKTKNVDEMMISKSSPGPKYNHSDPSAFCDPTVTSWSGCE